MTSTPRSPYLWFAGNPRRACSLVAPIDNIAECGSPGHGEFILEHRRTGDSLVMMLTVDAQDGSATAVSVSIPAALVRGLLDHTPEPSGDVVPPSFLDTGLKIASAGLDAFSGYKTASRNRGE